MSDNVDMKKVHDKIRKLLAMANDVSSPNEAAIAAGQAERLMRKHNIEQADVLINELDEGSVEISTVDHVATIYGSNYKASGCPRWVSVTAVSAARLFECETDLNSSGWSRFYGVEGDASMAAEMFRYLIKTINRLAKAYQGGRREKNSFRIGCAGEIQRRINEIVREREAEMATVSSGTALMVLKTQLIEQRTGQKFSYSKGGRISDRMAYMDGREAGKGVSLNNQIDGPGQRPAIGE